MSTEATIDEGREVARRISGESFRWALVAGALAAVLAIGGEVAGWGWSTGAAYGAAGGMLFLFGVSLILDLHIRQDERAEAGAPATGGGD